MLHMLKTVGRLEGPFNDLDPIKGYLPHLAKDTFKPTKDDRGTHPTRDAYTTTKTTTKSGGRRAELNDDDDDDDDDGMRLNGVQAKLSR